MIKCMVLAALLTLAARGQSGRGYPPGVEANFMRACESQSSVRGLCTCAWGQIEAHVRPSDFAALERLSETERNRSPVKQQIDAYTRTCLAQLQPAEPASTP